MTEAMTAPGIDVRRLRPGTVIFVDADRLLYELTVTHPAHGLMMVDSSDRALCEKPVGQLVQSRHGSESEPPEPCWIGKGLSMEIRFSNGAYFSPAVVSASLYGKREDGIPWSYDVF